MSKFVSENFLPVKIHIREQPDTFKRFGARWTPTLLILDSEGAERHRMEGFSPVEDLLGGLELGLAKLAFQKSQYGEAEKRFRAIYETYPSSAAAPEAAYWAGVSAYKASNKGEYLADTAVLLKEKFPESEWYRKASVWLS